MEDKTEKPLGEEGIEGESREKAGWEKEFLAQGKDAMASYIADTADWPWCDHCRGYHHPKNPTCQRGKMEIDG